LQPASLLGSGLGSRAQSAATRSASGHGPRPAQIPPGRRVGPVIFLGAEVNSLRSGESNLAADSHRNPFADASRNPREPHSGAIQNWAGPASVPHAFAEGSAIVSQITFAKPFHIVRACSHYWDGGDGSQFFRVLGARSALWSITGATSDNEIGKTGPVPSGCGANSAILRCRPRRWGLPQPSAVASSGRIFARNAIHPNSVSRPSGGPHA